MTTIVGWGRPRFKAALHPIAGVIVQAHKNDAIPPCEKKVTRPPAKRPPAKPRPKV